MALAPSPTPLRSQPHSPFRHRSVFITPSSSSVPDSSRSVNCSLSSSHSSSGARSDPFLSLSPASGTPLPNNPCPPFTAALARPRRRARMQADGTPGAVPRGEGKPGSKPESSRTGKGGGVPSDPQWRDVFPAYLQSKGSRDSGPGYPGGSGYASAGQAPGRTPVDSDSVPDGLGRSLGPSSEQAVTASQFTVGPTPDSMPKFVREPGVRNEPIWAAIRAEAKLEAEQEPILSSFLYASILAHDCFERSLGFVLANRLKNVTLLATQLMDVFDDVLMRNDIQDAIRADVQAVRDRDPSCRSYSSALLYYKGYHALQSYRIAHALWNRGQKILALALQSRISEVFAVDIHPAARIGRGILMDHGTGVVIGETAVVGDHVSMLQGVTLGGTGKEAGDRHPKIAEGVLIGAGATILGNIKVGRGSMIAAGSLVLKDIPPHSMVAGTPAKVVGTLLEKSPSLTMQHDVTKQYCDKFEEEERRRSLGREEQHLDQTGGI